MYKLIRAIVNEENIIGYKLLRKDNGSINSLQTVNVNTLAEKGKIDGVSYDRTKNKLDINGYNVNFLGVEKLGDYNVSVSFTEVGILSGNRVGKVINGNCVWVRKDRKYDIVDSVRDYLNEFGVHCANNDDEQFKLMKYIVHLQENIDNCRGYLGVFKNRWVSNGAKGYTIIKIDNVVTKDTRVYNKIIAKYTELNVLGLNIGMLFNSVNDSYFGGALSHYTDVVWSKRMVKSMSNGYSDDTSKNKNRIAMSVVYHEFNNNDILKNLLNEMIYLHNGNRAIGERFKAIEAYVLKDGFKN